MRIREVRWQRLSLGSNKVRGAVRIRPAIPLHKPVMFRRIGWAIPAQRKVEQ